MLVPNDPRNTYSVKGARPLIWNIPSHSKSPQTAPATSKAK